MQIHRIKNVSNSFNIKFKGSESNQSKTDDSVNMPSDSKVLSSAYKAYSSPQMNNGYKVCQTFSIPFYKNQKMYELSNGQKIIIIKRPGPTMIYTSVGCGELNEADNKRGLAHLREHLSANALLYPQSEDDKSFINKEGCNFNAETDDTSTSYYVKAPVQNAEELDKLLKVYAKTLQNNNFSDKQLEDEKKIINEEEMPKSSGVDNFYVERMEVIKTLFNKSDMHNYKSTPETLNNITHEDLQNFYDKYYTPENMVTTIIGNVDDDTIKTVAKDFSILKPHNNQEKPKDEIPTDNPIQKTVRKDIEGFNSSKNAKDYYTLAFVGPNKLNKKEEYAVGILNRAIENKIKQDSKENLTYHSVEASSNDISNDLSKPSYIKIEGTSKPKSTEDEIKNLYKVINDLQTKPISQDELEKIKASNLNITQTPIEDSESLANILNIATITDGTPDDQTLEFMKTITPAEIQNAAKKYFDLNKAALVVIHPKKEQPTENKSAENSSITQKSVSLKSKNISFTGNINNLDMQDVHEYTLPNNLHVIIDARQGNLRSAVNFELKSQKTLRTNPIAFDIRGMFLPSEDTENKLDKEHINFSTRHNPLILNASLNGNADKTLDMIGYAAGILLNPDKLSPEIFNESKKILLKYYDKVNPEDKIVDELNKENPNVNPKKSLIYDLNYDEIEKSYKEFLSNAQGQIVITMPKDEFEKDKSQIFQTLSKVPTLKQSNIAWFFNKYRPQPLDKTTVYVKANDKNNVIISKYFKTVESGNIKDRAGLILLNQILGGDTESRLFQKLRTKDKVTYNADSSFMSNHTTADWSAIAINTRVLTDNKDNVKTAINDINSCVNDLVQNKVKDNELQHAKAKVKSDILSQLAITNESNQYMAKNSSSFYGKDYEQELMNAINEITPDEIQQLAKIYLTQPTLIGIEGNKEALEENKDLFLAQGDVVTLKDKA